MALVDATLSAALQAIDTQMLAAAEAGTPWTSAQYRNAMAKAIDDQIKTATVTSSVPGTGLTADGSPVIGTATGTGTVS